MEVNVSPTSMFEGGCLSGVLKAIELDVFILKKEDASYLFGFPVFLEKSECLATMGLPSHRAMVNEDWVAVAPIRPGMCSVQSPILHSETCYVWPLQAYCRIMLFKITKKGLGGGMLHLAISCWNLKPTAVGVFTPQKLAIATNHGFPPLLSEYWFTEFRKPTFN